MESRVTRVMGFFPANFQLPVPFHTRLMVSHWTDRQADRQTNKHTTVINALCPTIWGRGHNKLPTQKSWQWVSGSWVIGQMGQQSWVGQVGHGSVPVTRWPIFTARRRYT